MNTPTLDSAIEASHKTESLIKRDERCKIEQLMSVPTVLALLSIITMLPTSGFPQPAQSPAIALLAGASRGELPGPDEGFDGLILSLRYQHPLGRVVQAEASVTGLFTTSTCWFPELGIQAAIPWRRVRPYVGIGAGYAFLGSGDNRTTGHFALGIRLQPTHHIGVVAEIQARAVAGAWYTGAVMGGLRWQFR
jgi:hypothetical protein